MCIRDRGEPALFHEEIVQAVQEENCLEDLEDQEIVRETKNLAQPGGQVRTFLQADRGRCAPVKGLQYMYIYGDDLDPGSTRQTSTSTSTDWTLPDPLPGRRRTRRSRAAKYGRDDGPTGGDARQAIRALSIQLPDTTKLTQPGGQIRT